MISTPEVSKEAVLAIQAKHDDANRLTRLTRGRVRITHEGRMHFERDHESLGHLYSGAMRDPHDEHYLTLDDRKDASLAEQLVSELRRIGQLYANAAMDTEDAISGEKERWAVVLHFPDDREDFVRLVDTHCEGRMQVGAAESEGLTAELLRAADLDV